MNKFKIFIGIIKVPLDILAYFIAANAAYLLRPSTDLIPFYNIPFVKEQLISASAYADFMIYSCLAFVVIQAFMGVYRFDDKRGFLKEISLTFSSLFILLIAIVAYYAIFYVETFFSRGVLYMIFVFTALFSTSFRLFLHLIQRTLYSYGYGVRRVLLIGAAKNRKSIESELLHYPEYQVLDSVSKLTKKEKLKSYDEIWLIQDDNNESVQAIVEYAQSRHILYRFIPNISSVMHARVEEGTIGSFPILTTQPTTLDGWSRVTKRLFDICFSLAFIVVFSPIYILTAILVKLDSKGPVFYVSNRIGKKGKIIPVLKFRSMVVDADQLKEKLAEFNQRKDSPLFKMKDDPRITPFGKFIRRFSIDEFPQFFNVLMGHMSIVGPRPHLPKEVEQYTEDQKRVLFVKPGITGLPQISGRSDLDFSEEIRLDIFYIVNWSLLLDIKIVLKTPIVLLGGKGAD